MYFYRQTEVDPGELMEGDEAFKDYGRLCSQDRTPVNIKGSPPKKEWSGLGPDHYMSYLYWSYA